MLDSDLDSDGMDGANGANLSLQRQLVTLEKEEEELEWELNDYGWKLDRVAQVIYRAEEERADLQTQLGQAHVRNCIHGHSLNLQYYN